MHEWYVEFFEFAFHCACHSIEQNEVGIGVELEQRLVVDIPLIANIPNTVATSLNIGIRNVINSRNAGYAPGFTDCIKHGDMSGKHHHDAFGTCPAKSSGISSPLQTINSHVVTLSTPCQRFLTLISTHSFPAAPLISKPEAYWGA